VGGNDALCRPDIEPTPRGRAKAVSALSACHRTPKGLVEFSREDTKVIWRLGEPAL